MTDSNNNFTPDGSEKASDTETRAQRRERLEAEKKAEKLRVAEEKKQARIEEKKQAAEARRKAKEKPPLTAEEKAQKAARAKHIKIAAIVCAALFVLLMSAAAIGGYIVTAGDTNYPNVRINGIMSAV